MGPLVHAERDVSRLGGVVDRVESLLPELFHGLGRHQQVSVRELLQNARPECRASPTIDTHLSVGSLLDAQRVEGVETVGGRREGARPRRGPLPPGLPFRFTPVALLVRDDRAHHERDVPRRDHHDSLVLEPVVLRRLDDLHLFGGGRFGDGGWRGAGLAPRHRRTQTLRAAAVVVALGVAAQRTLMGDSLPKRRDDLALGRALPDPEKTDDDFPDLNPIDFFLFYLEVKRSLEIRPVEESVACPRFVPLIIGNILTQN
jgi:hypothetical protein